MSAEREDLPCDVCDILDGDKSIKPTRYCPLCNKNLCEKCRKSWRRVEAAGKYHANNLKNAFLTGLGIEPKPEEPTKEKE